jgi:FO synthase subunit 2
LAQVLLNCGVNDLGGTLINESISTAAGAAFGQLMAPADLRRCIRQAGRLPAQRNTRYDILREFPAGCGEGPSDPLDQVADAEGQFGSFHRLIAAEEHRYQHRSIKLGVS